MGARGPQPLPSAIKLGRGTFRKDRAAKNEAAPVGKPSLPKWVADADAKKEWKRIIKTLTAMGLIGAADQNLLVRYVVAWARWRRVADSLMKSPGAEYAIYKDAKGSVTSIQVSALHSIARSLADELSKAEGALGMNPSARSRINAELPAKGKSEKSRFFDPPFKDVG